MMPLWHTEDILLWLNAYYSCSFLITICSLYWVLIEQLRFIFWEWCPLCCITPTISSVCEIAKSYNFSLIPELLLSYAVENIESPDYTNVFCWVILTNTLNNIFDITFCSHTDNLDVIEWVDQESVLKIHFLTH